MKKTKEPAYVAATLKWCNARRKGRGKKPLKRLPMGRRMDPWSCPCGKTCRLSVGTSFWMFQDEGGDLGRPLPPHVKKFVIAFDAGKLPQYEQKAAK